MAVRTVFIGFITDMRSFRVLLGRFIVACFHGRLSRIALSGCAILLWFYRLLRSGTRDAARPLPEIGQRTFVAVQMCCLSPFVIMQLYDISNGVARMMLR
jgi:hypothetical protein